MAKDPPRAPTPSDAPSLRKKLVLFCDGTWNGLRMQDRTNVSRLAKCVKPYDEHGVQQIIFYDEGVGVGAHIAPLTDTLVKYLGGVFGRGLDRKVEEAYRFLVLNYEPGDDIYIFGFSRGAFTARSLCGMIRKVGPQARLLRPDAGSLPVVP